MFRPSFILLFLVTFIRADNQYEQILYRELPFHEKIPVQNPIILRTYPVVIEENSYRVFIIAKVMYDYLQFTYEKEAYNCEFQIESHLINQKDKRVYSKIWKSEFNLDNFQETNRRDKFFLTLDSLTIPAGKYKLRFLYQDLQGKQKTLIELKLNFPISEEFYASPPLFCNTNTEPESKISSLPAWPEPLGKYVRFGNKTSLYLHCWAAETENIDFEVTMQSKRLSKTVYQNTFTTALEHEQTEILLDIPFKEWQEGKYELIVTYRWNSKSFKQKLPIEIIWFNKPLSLYNLDNAIKPLKLILSEEKFESIKSGNSEQQRKNFMDYWKNQDQTPNTAFNEVMEEFYSRIDSVNQDWGQKRRRGWKTDPGKIYVLYGKPDKIEDNSLNPVNPYLRWIYYEDGEKLIFTFRALNGRKLYKLIDQAKVSANDQR